jgi:hypothetical protein
MCVVLYHIRLSWPCFFGRVINVLATVTQCHCLRSSLKVFLVRYPLAILGQLGAVTAPVRSAGSRTCLGSADLSIASSSEKKKAQHPSHPPARMPTVSHTRSSTWEEARPHMRAKSSSHVKLVSTSQYSPRRLVLLASLVSLPLADPSSRSMACRPVSTVVNHDAL